MAYAKRRLQVETTKLICIENDNCLQLLEGYGKSEMSRDRWSVQAAWEGFATVSHVAHG